MDDELEELVEGDDDNEFGAEGFAGVLARTFTQVTRQRIGTWRQIVGTRAYTRGMQELAAITPHSSHPEFPGIRSYYPAARELRGLDVASNWAITPVRVDTDDKAESFVLTEVRNPHPGAWVMMFGPEQESYLQETHYVNPSPQRWPRKSRRLLPPSFRPVKFTTWQSLAGQALSFHPSPFNHPAVRERPGFADEVYAIANKWGTEGAAEAFKEAEGKVVVPAKTTFTMRIDGNVQRITVADI